MPRTRLLPASALLCIQEVASISEVLRLGGDDIVESCLGMYCFSVGAFFFSKAVRWLTYVLNVHALSCFFFF